MGESTSNGMKYKEGEGERGIEYEFPVKVHFIEFKIQSPS